MNYKTYGDLSHDIRQSISVLQKYNFDLVVGLPRSGLTPANIIALYLNVNCTDLKSLVHNVELKSGSTRASKTPLLEYPQDAERILIIDDSIASGNSLKLDLNLIPLDLHGKITTCAVYSSKVNRDDVDFYLKYLPMPRVFEWNIFHHSLISNSCFDIDGVLCKDPTDEENDDGEKYIDFILNAYPLFIPTGKIFALVTSRLEKYRKETEVWLNKHNIEYEFLIMLDLSNKEERQKMGIHGKHKANFYKKSKSILFLESEYNQSVEILNIANKPVYCVDENVMLLPGINYKVKEISKRRIKQAIASILPHGFKIILKRLILNKK
jgi:uncharacterized HAD superfamily protein